MKQAGIDLTVTRVSGDGYWSNVWLKVPFCAVAWENRPAIDMQLSQTYLSNAAWNDTRWKRPEFDKLMVAARTEENEAKLHEMYNEAQKMIHDDGGMICYAVRRLSRRLCQEGRRRRPTSPLRHVRPARG